MPKTIQLSLEGLNFLNSCLQYDADKRITLDKLIYSPYMTEDPRMEEVNNLAISHIGGGNNAHDQVLVNPYSWLKRNANKIIQLNSQTPEAYEAYCLKIYEKTA